MYICNTRQSVYDIKLAACALCTNCLPLIQKITNDTQIQLILNRRAFIAKVNCSIYQEYVVFYLFIYKAYAQMRKLIHALTLSTQIFHIYFINYIWFYLIQLGIIETHSLFLSECASGGFTVQLIWTLFLQNTFEHVRSIRSETRDYKKTQPW